MSLSRPWEEIGYGDTDLVIANDATFVAEDFLTPDFFMYGSIRLKVYRSSGDLLPHVYFDGQKTFICIGGDGWELVTES